MSAVELRGWEEYLAKEPINSTEIQLALLAQITNNVAGGKLKLNDALITEYKVSSFDNKPVSNDQILAIFS